MRAWTTSPQHEIHRVISENDVGQTPHLQSICQDYATDKALARYIVAFAAVKA